MTEDESVKFATWKKKSEINHFIWSVILVNNIQLHNTTTLIVHVCNSQFNDEEKDYLSSMLNQWNMPPTLISLLWIATIKNTLINSLDCVVSTCGFTATTSHGLRTHESMCHNIYSPKPPAAVDLLYAKKELLQRSTHLLRPKISVVI